MTANTVAVPHCRRRGAGYARAVAVLFQRVVPSAPVRPQGGGHRRQGDREVLAAIIFVATSGCTWNQLPPGFGLGCDGLPPVHRVDRGQGVGQTSPPGPG
ncbi:transposase [Streptomyces echinatus]|uniref:transposase n=1 Tax=Streptomyces echinatus TaxID=67293 RepID=UPI00355708EC